jgi:hypothetical protein
MQSTNAPVSPATDSCGAGTKDRFVCFMRGARGRAARGVLGVALLAVAALVGGTAGVALAVFALVPIGSAATGICPLGPLFGTDFRGNPRVAR